MIRTRFAPSPTGFMHIGGVRTALYAYLIAKQHNGKFILRIEDTDQNRYVDGAIDVIYQTLRDLGLNWDEGPDIGGDYGPYTQSERKDLYLKYAEQLVNEGKAYYCFCDEQKIESQKEQAKLNKKPYKYDGFCRNLSMEEVNNLKQNQPYVIRFKMPKTGTVSFEDIVYGKVEVDCSELEDLIIIKSDGMPTYNFANIIDDSLMEITHIIRGNEYISSTPKYLKIYEAFGFPVPSFIHLPVIKKDKYSDKKLSKRDNDATVELLQQHGYLNEAIINMLALTGWSSEDNTEIFSLEELVKVFDPKRIGKSNAVFDHEKLNWLNNHYIRQLSSEKLYDFLIPFITKEYNINDVDKTWLTEVFSLYQEQLKYATEINDLIEIFFKEISLNEDAKDHMKDDLHKQVVSTFIKELESLTEFDDEVIKQTINNVKDKTGAKGKALFMSIRIAVSKQMHGPELITLIRLLGKQKVIEHAKGVLGENI